MNSKPRYHLTLEPVAQGPWRTPPLLRLRALLKAALRGYGLRCISATEHPAPAPEAPEAGQAPTEGQQWTDAAIKAHAPGRAIVGEPGARQKKGISLEGTNPGRFPNALAHALANSKLEVVSHAKP
jgi:hypothetical protein